MHSIYGYDISDLYKKIDLLILGQVFYNENDALVLFPAFEGTYVSQEICSNENSLIL